MNHVWAIARKELRGYFHSAVAIIFLLAFLAAVLFTFFHQEKFFVRGVADLRPMFIWLPRLLIFLVAALSMRLWSEEHKVGTIELLLTLPVPIHKLVLGKFLAGLLLISLALAMTFGLPITVSFLGELDWGPVVGGYLAALLLAAAYLSIGLCVSASTDNQIVSLVMTALLCGLLYLPGVDAVAGTFGYTTGEILRALGTGTRFESVARGVVDLRDAAYWGGMIVFALVLNTFILQAKRWGRGVYSNSVRRSARVTVALLAANAIVLCLWLAPVSRFRLDLTQDREFTLSDVTEELLGSLEQPLLIRGYFSEESHPKLSTLVPQIRDRLLEYRAKSHGNIRLEFVDPSKDASVEKEANEQYSIKPFSFEYADQHQRKLTNAYFHLLITYGTQHQVVPFNELIDIVPSAGGDIDVRLRNLEYDLTKTIKKVVTGFQGVEALFAAMPEKAVLTFYASSDAPDAAVLVPKMDKIGKQIEAESNGKFVYKRVDPPTTVEEARKLYVEEGIAPYGGGIYMHPVIRVGKRSSQVVLPEALDDGEIREAITGALRRSAPGFLKVVGMLVPPTPKAQPQIAGIPPQPEPPKQSFRQVAELLGEEYEVRNVTLDSGRVEEDVDVLLVAGPQALSDNQKLAIDQFLMRGGGVIVALGNYRFDTAATQLMVEKVDSGLDEMLKSYGVESESKMVVDSNAVRMPLPVRTPQGFRDKLVNYPFFALIERNQMSENHLAVGGLNAVIVPWGSPLKLTVPEVDEEDDDGDDEESDDEGERPVRGQVLLRSGADTWLETRTDVQPDFGLHPDKGFGRPADSMFEGLGPHVLAVALTGSFQSYFGGAGKKLPAGMPAGREPIAKAAPGARLVVLGSSEILSDLFFTLARERLPEGKNNEQFIQNLVDWSVEDVDLLSIRARGTHTHVMRVDEEKALNWEIVNWGLVAMGLALVFGLGLMGRKTLVPMSLPPRAGKNSEKKPTGHDEQEEES